MTAEMRRILQAYVDAWNAPDDPARRASLAASWADDATYTDPTVHLAGRDALVGHCRRLAERRPGTEIVMTSGIDHHHGLVRFAWQARAADGAVLREGVDFAEFAEDGRLQRIVGFFDPLPD